MFNHSVCPHGVVVSSPLSMREVLGSIPSVSKCLCLSNVDRWFPQESHHFRSWICMYQALLRDMLVSSTCARPLAGQTKSAQNGERGRQEVVFPPSRVRLTHPTNCDGYTERTVSTRRVRSREPCNGRQRHVHRFAPKCQGSSTLPRPPVAERSRQAGQPASLQPDHFDKQHSQLSLSSLLREQKF